MDAKGYVGLRSVRKGASAAQVKVSRARRRYGKRNSAEGDSGKGSSRWGKIAWVATIGWFLRPDVCFTRLNNRIGLAPRGA